VTTPCRDGNREPWANWVTENPRLDSRLHGLSVTNSDLWVHRYMTCVDRVGTRELQHLMLVEVKTHGASEPFAQADTYHALDQVLRQKKKVRVFRLAGGKAWLRCWGVHHLTMSGDDPGSSGWIKWDGKPITAGELEEVLRLERSPDTLRPREDRRHHTRSQVARSQIELALVEESASAA